MHHNHWVLLELARERERDLVRRLKYDQLVRQAELVDHPDRHKFYHVLDWVGRQLVRGGERLQAQHAMHHRQSLNHTLGG